MNLNQNNIFQHCFASKPRRTNNDIKAAYNSLTDDHGYLAINQAFVHCLYTDQNAELVAFFLDTTYVYFDDHLNEYIQSPNPDPVIILIMLNAGCTLSSVTLLSIEHTLQLVVLDFARNRQDFINSLVDYEPACLPTWNHLLQLNCAYPSNLLRLIRL
jgi:hypothetical protein